jgi:hypothetical protein
LTNIYSEVLKWDFLDYFFSTYSTLLHLVPLRFHYVRGPEAEMTFNKTDLNGIYLPMQLTDWLFVEVALQSLRQNRVLTLILAVMAGKKLPNMKRLAEE